MSLRILFAAPGHYMVRTGGGSRVVLEVCRALAREADVTAAFRGLVDHAGSESFPVVALQPEASLPPEAARSSNAARGLNPLPWLACIRAFERFAQTAAGRFDCVIEYGWRGSGVLCSAFTRRGVPAVAAEHFPRVYLPGLPRSPRELGRRLALAVTERLAAHRLRGMPIVLAETEVLRDDLVRRNGLQAARVRTAPLGVDSSRFAPRDHAECRAELGLPEGRTVWLYVGGMDMYHDMQPCLQAVAEADRDDVLLVLVGTGIKRAQWERAAGPALGRRILFCGRQPHERVPAYIGAADLCLAPYDVGLFPQRTVTFSTLKVREYLACGRPVVTVPSGTLRDLVARGRNGFVFGNTRAEWHGFLSAAPQRDELRAMAPTIARQAPRRSWAETSACYLAACRDAVDRHSAT
jgi:glycosyltransferase involved in cell wall biosynthesis